MLPGVVKIITLTWSLKMKTNNKLTFPNFPYDPYYFQCCSAGHIHINSWLNKKTKYRDQKGTYYYTYKERKNYER